MHVHALNYSANAQLGNFAQRVGITSACVHVPCQQAPDPREASTPTITTITAALQRWQMLPEVPSAQHVALLQSFQQIVELKESARLLLDVQNATRGSSNHSFQDLTETLEAWRLRTPNEWESLSHWQDVLMWRNQIYNNVITAFARLRDSHPNLHQLGFKDKAWSVNKLAAVALKHGAADACLQILNTMYGYNAMEVQEVGANSCM